jgi:hypothetical protein
MKVGDFIQSSAFVEQNGIVIEVEGDADGPWYQVMWLKVNKGYFGYKGSRSLPRKEWVRGHEIEARDIS